MGLSRILSTLSDLSRKFSYYKQRYGVAHSVFSYIGRKNMFFWNLVGSSVTRPYLKRYLATHEHRILNLGGGDNYLHECLTVDVLPRADAYVDITKRLPFNDASIDAIFCEEVIEHVGLDSGRFMLTECRRVLKPNGILRLITPDLDWFSGHAPDSIQSCHEINNIFYDHDHRYLYTRRALRFFGEEAGFVDLHDSVYQDPKSSLGYLDSHADRFEHPAEISQFLELRKPDY